MDKKRNRDKDKNEDFQGRHESTSETQDDAAMEDDVCELVEDEDEQVELTEAELKSLKGQLDEKSKECDEYLDMLQRKAAEFDNYKKRTIREKESIYINSVADVVEQLLPVLDDLERAVESCQDDNQSNTLLEGVKMVLKKFNESFSKPDVEAIKAEEGDNFNPEYHEAVMHIEDDDLADNVILEEFQKGYKVKDKVIRYSKVKVAN